MRTERKSVFRIVGLLVIPLGLLVQSAYALTCDVDGDNDIDRRDIGLILDARTTPANGPTDPRDADGDGRITLRDATMCTARCTRPLCAITSAPIANAGPDQTVSVGATVTLNGSASSDPDGDPLTFAWAFVFRPSGSTAVLHSAKAVNPTFVVDVPGRYIVALIVNDGTRYGFPDSVKISTQNSRPVANAGPDQTVAVGATAQLNGAASSDPDGDPLTFAWSFVSRPAGSAAVLSNAGEVNPTFIADAIGTYVVQLIVNDGTLGSATDTVTISTFSGLAISNLVAPPTIPLGGTLGVSFDYTDAEGDIVALERTQIFASGNQVTATIPAGILGIRGQSGQASLSVDARALFFGTNTFTLRLRDRAGNLSNTLLFSVDLIGATTGGAAPVLEELGVTPDAWNRPAEVSYGSNGRGVRNKLTPPFTLRWTDPNGDVARVRVRVVDPTGRDTMNELAAKAVGVAGSTGSTARSLLTFDARSPLGTYTVQATLIDRDGNASNTLETTLALVASGGSVPLAITGFTPGSGAAGTEVVITGTSFDADRPETNVVTLSQIPAQITSVSATSIKALVPHGAGIGKFIVSNRAGVAVSEGVFSMPMAVTLAPATASVAVGGREQFKPIMVSAPSTQVAWSVNGLPGGSSTFGTIAPEGLYTAPASVPPGGTVTVRAALEMDPTVVGEATVRILPPPVIPGRTRVLASVGGSVPSEEGEAEVAIPGGALPADTEVSIENLVGPSRPVPEAGRRLLGAVRLGPAGLVFNAPVTVTLPLARFIPPGTHLPVSIVDPATGLFIRNEGIIATVREDGSHAVTQVSHFSILAIDEPVPAPSPLAPTITLIEPASAQEGLHVPVRVRGTNLTAGMTVEVRDPAGNPTTAITTGPLFANGNEVGFMLHIKTDPTLGEGQSRTYTIRLAGPFGQAAEAPITVLGLDELVVTSGTFALPPFPGPDFTRRFSEVRIGPGATVNSPERLAGIESTGRVYIEGALSADGANGAGGFGRAPGFKPSGGRAGSGGLGRNDSGCFLGDDGFDCAEPENWGEDADDCIGDNHNNPRRTGDCRFVTNQPQGMGGRPGENDNFDLLDVISTLIELVGCVASGGASCSIQLGVDVLTAAYEVIDAAVADGVNVGANGFGGLLGSGGGGAGGGGEVHGVPGGGGGAGGEPGRAVRIITPNVVVVDSPLTARGGSGGSGGRIEVPDCSAIADLTLRTECYAGAGMLIPVTLPDPVTIAGLSVEQIEGLFVNSGGGGGGGAGGSLRVAAGRGVFKGPGALVDSRGGEGGIGGITIIDPLNARTLSVVQRRALGRPGAGGALQLSDAFANPGRPVFDPNTIQNMVTDRTLLRDVRVGASPHPDLIPGEFPPAVPAPIAVSVTCEATGEVFSTVVQRPAGEPVVVDLVLCPGFNTVAAEVPGATMHELLRKRILVMAVDSDGDGLGDRDELVLGTDPNNRDTDGDGVADGQEVVLGTNPRVADSDGDGLTDAQEVARGTDPTRFDSDGDGFSDGAEVALGSNPTSNTIRPASIPEGTLLAASAGGFLSVLDRATGLVGPLGRPNGGLGFGIAFDDQARLYVAAFDRLLVADPLGRQPDGSLAVTEVGAFGAPSGIPIHAASLAFNAVDGMLYGIELGPSPEFRQTDQLVMISPANGAAQRIGTIGPREFHALVFDQGGRLFTSAADAAGSDRFLELDPATGAVVGDIGPIGAKDVFGLAFDKDGVLWATALRGGTEGQLLTIDAATGLGTPVVNIDRAAFGIAIQSPRSPSLAGIVVADPGGGAFGRGLLFRIDPTTGNRTVLSDFNDAAQGPIGADPRALGIESGGAVLVADNSSGAGFRGTLFRMSPATGIRTVLSDFANAAQGPLGTDPLGVAIESAGTILVADPGGAQGDPNLLFRVDPATGMRTILSDFTDPAQGPTGENPSGLTLDHTGRILVATGQTGTGLRGVLFRVDPTTGTRELLSDFGDANQGPRGDLPYGVALEPGGTILVTTIFKLDGIGTSFNGTLFRVDPTDGTRTILSAFGDPAQGPVGFTPSGVAIEPSGSILVAAQHVGTFDSPGGIFRVDPVTGERSLVSDFGNASQGPLGVNPTGVAIILAPSP